MCCLKKGVRFMPIFFILLGISSVVFLALSIFGLFNSHKEKARMLCCFFLAISLIGIFVCIYEYLQFIGLMKYAYIAEIGGIMSLALAIIFIFRSRSLGANTPTLEEKIKNKRTIREIRQWIRHIDI